MSHMTMLGKLKNTHAYRTLKEYSECATVHGISYIFEKVEHATSKFAIYLAQAPADKLEENRIIFVFLNENKAF